MKRKWNEIRQSIPWSFFFHTPYAFKYFFHVMNMIFPRWIIRGRCIAKGQNSNYTCKIPIKQFYVKLIKWNFQYLILSESLKLYIWNISTKSLDKSASTEVRRSNLENVPEKRFHSSAFLNAFGKFISLNGQIFPPIPQHFLLFHAQFSHNPYYLFSVFSALEKRGMHSENLEGKGI